MLGSNKNVHLSILLEAKVSILLLCVINTDLSMPFKTAKGIAHSNVVSRIASIALTILVSTAFGSEFPTGATYL
jgi:hypothetical protein